MTITRHEVRFERNTVTGLWRARCVCLWSMDGTQEDVQKYAAAHDQWVPAEAAGGVIWLTGLSGTSASRTRAPTRG